MKILRADPELLNAIKTITTPAPPETTAEQMVEEDAGKWFVIDKLDKGGKDWGSFCCLCKKFLTPQHVIQDEHRRKRENPEEHLSREDAEWFRVECAAAIKKAQQKQQHQDEEQQKKIGAAAATPKAIVDLPAVKQSAAGAAAAKGERLGADDASEALTALIRMANRI